MNKLDDLISELCPDGVEFKRLGDVCLNTANISWAANKNKTFRYIDLASVDRETHSIGDTAAINSENAPSRAQKVVKADDVIFGTTRPTLKRYSSIPTDYDGQICSTGYCVLRADKTQVLPRYIYHQISTTEFGTYVEMNQRGSAYPAISDGDVKAYTIPVPPLLVQQEIVRILDKFTLLEAELEVELEVELEARKKQYEYYLDFLLNFENECSNSVVQWLTLNEAGIMKRGTYVTQKNIEPGDIPVILGGQEPAYYCNTSNHEGEAIVISRSGAYAGFVSFWNQPIFVTDGFIIETKDKLKMKYLYYYLKNMQGDLHQMKRGGGVPHVRGNEVMKIKIPIPTLEEQNRIVAILDRFDALVNDITQSLPTEIAARRKQYEYYRDKLLTFKEKVS